MIFLPLMSYSSRSGGLTKGPIFDTIGAERRVERMKQVKPWGEYEYGLNGRKRHYDDDFDITGVFIFWGVVFLVIGFLMFI